jgi:hypothetical protein
MSCAEQPTEERRFALRVSLRIPLIVMGRGDDESAWSEPTQTDDISTIGTQFELNQRVDVGERLLLRAQRSDGKSVEASALIVRTAPAAFGCQKVGVRVESPDDSWLRLFVSWVAETSEPGEEPAGETAITRLVSVDRRRHAASEKAVEKPSAV